MKKIKHITTSILMITIILILSTKAEASTGKVNVETVRIRKEATTKSTIVTQLDKGQEVEILEELEDWYKVTFTDKDLGKISGYISKELLDVKKDDTENNNTQNNSSVNENNNVDNTSVKNSNTVANETNANENTEENNETPNNEDIPADIVEQKIEEENEYQLEQSISIKILPLINSREKATIQNGTIKIIEIINDWCKIESETEAGWIRTNILKKTITNSENPTTQEVSNNEVQEPTTQEENNPTTEPEKTQEPEDTKPAESTKVIKTGYVSTDSLKVRKEASTSSEMIDSLKKNDQVSILEELDGWYKIKISGEIGYVSSKYISDKKVEDTTSRGTETQRTQEQTTEIEREETPKDSTTGTTGASVVEYAKQYLGYKYVSGGTSPSTGFDCSGFTMYVYKHFGITLNRTSKDQIKNGTAVEKSNLQLGDIVVFNGDSNTSIGHVGIYVGNGNFIHASNPTGGVKITALSSSYYNTRYVGARRVI